MHPRRQQALCVILAIFLGSIAIARVVGTYSIFNHTFDEGAHLAAGMQWLSHGNYTYEPKHPILGRTAIALGPYLDGLRSLDHTSIWTEGNALLYARESYFRTLTLARLGVIPFFMAAALLVWGWARQLHGDVGALAAVALFTTVPTVLAHAGVATNDVALTACLTGTLFAFVRWLEQPLVIRAVILGLAFSLAVLSKLSALPFGAAATAALLLFWWIDKRGLRTAGDGGDTERRIAWRTATAALAAVTTVIAIWGAHGFSTSTFHGWTLPLPNEIKLGVWQLRHMQAGSIETSNAFLLGRWSREGFWYYFPVALLFKTPLPLFILASIGVVAAFRKRAGLQRWQLLAPAVVCMAILASTFFSHINIGVRHVLPVYPLLAILGAQGAMILWQGRQMLVKSVAVMLLVWQGASSAAAHPDYLSYFNEIAGQQHPRHVLLDSNLDWGQDLQRLSHVLRTRGISELSIAYFGSADIRRHGLPRPSYLAPDQHVTGWIAISETLRHGGYLARGKRDGYQWLDAYEPPERVGASILLYHVPE